MEQRPEALIGEALIVALQFLRREVQRQEVDAAAVTQPRARRIRGITDLAAPTEPEAAGTHQRLAHRDRETAGLAVAARVHHAVRRDDHAPAAKPRRLSYSHAYLAACRVHASDLERLVVLRAHSLWGSLYPLRAASAGRCLQSCCNGPRAPAPGRAGLAGPRPCPRDGLRT